VECKETIVVGGQNDFIKVTHLKMRCSNLDIGAKLGELAKSRHRIKKPVFEDKMRTMCQRKYLLSWIVKLAMMYRVIRLFENLKYD